MDRLTFVLAFVIISPCLLFLFLDYLAACRKIREANRKEAMFMRIVGYGPKMYYTWRRDYRDRLYVDRVLRGGH
jgi:hypothetical protein